ncbi:glycosyltransferase family 4 protein [Curtobacterium sp. MCBD17_040]|uniref:glycosyltransferase family 4 protein n=1 Tax=Curtobacterium sp. MCBD17_040 TaxID=2175674 RepID=UPI000DA7BACB|nr:glycosyltransferase family 4 protein [Curtobacterium sp. MCBD17_040]WIB64142.1 glycosyltransferase family 4 protein [Curtobacterium sp. MCBD17_040]
MSEQQEGGQRRVRIAIVADGNPADPQTNSGLPHGVLRALEDRSDVAVVAAIDSTPTGLRKVITAVLSAHPDRQLWRNLYRKGSVARWARSAARDRRVSEAPAHDVVLQIGNTYRPAASAYAVLVDGTATLSQEWSGWALPQRAFERRVRAERRQFQAATVVFTLGEQVRREIVTRYQVPPAKVIAVGGGAAQGTQITAVNQERVPGSTILFVGVDFERKGGYELLQAFRTVRDAIPTARLIIAGCEPRREEEGVEWTGHVSRESIDRLYTQADVFCLPSLFEPFGLVVTEAMAHGLPCVVSNVGALPDLVQDDITGLVVTAAQPDALSDALLALLVNETRRLEMGRRGAARAAESTWVAVAEKIVAGLARGEASAG